MHLIFNEKNIYRLGLPEPPTYVKQLNYVSEMLEKDEVPQETVIQKLGNDVAALYSVPTAIYCFLRSQKPIKDIQVRSLKSGKSLFLVRHLHNL